MARAVLPLLALALLGPVVGGASGAQPAKRPNLVVMKTASADAGAPPGSLFDVDFRVRNVGARTAGRSRTEVRLGDLVVARLATQSREPGTVQRFTRRVRLPAAALPGVHDLRVCADAGRAVRESSERDNCRVVRDGFVVYAGG